VPDCVPEATYAKLRQLLAELDLPPLPSAPRTARQVVDEVATYQGLNAWDLEATHGRPDQPMLAWGLHENCAKRIKQAVDSLGGDDARRLSEQTAAIEALEKKKEEAEKSGERTDLEATELKEMKEMLKQSLEGQRLLQEGVHGNSLKLDQLGAKIDAGFAEQREGFSRLGQQIREVSATLVQELRNGNKAVLQQVVQVAAAAEDSQRTLAEQVEAAASATAEDLAAMKRDATEQVQGMLRGMEQLGSSLGAARTGARSVGVGAL